MSWLAGRTLESVIFHYLLYSCRCADAESAAGTKWLWVEAAPEVLDSPAICVVCEIFGAAVRKGVGPPSSLSSFPDGVSHVGAALSHSSWCPAMPAERLPWPCFSFLSDI